MVSFAREGSHSSGQKRTATRGGFRVADQLRPIQYAAGQRRACRLIQLCDSLHDECRVADELWSELRIFFPENALIEILMLAGFYRTVTYLTNAMDLPLEDVGIPFPS